MVCVRNEKDKLIRKGKRWAVRTSLFSVSAGTALLLLGVSGLGGAFGDFALIAAAVAFAAAAIFLIMSVVRARSR